MSCQLHSAAARFPGSKSWLRTYQEGRWASEPARTLCRKTRFFSNMRIKLRLPGFSVGFTVPNLGKGEGRYQVACEKACKCLHSFAISFLRSFKYPRQEFVLIMPECVFNPQRWDLALSVPNYNCACFNVQNIHRGQGKNV